MKKQVLLWLLSGVLFLNACQNNTIHNETASMTFTISEKPFGQINGDTITQYTITNPQGMQVSIINYGGTVTNLLVPGRDHELGDVVLGFDSLSGYLQKANPYFGCLVGRYGNRIAKGKFILDGQAYQLTLNDHGNTLHGGVQGLDKVIWQASKPAGDSSLKLTYTSKDGDQGFPGNLVIEVVYTLSSDNALQIAYSATTDKATPVNLTNHCYFNLSAGKQNTILDHEVMLQAEKFTAVDSLLIPTGQLPDVKGTPMDFTTPKKIGAELAAVKGGYDHNWVLKRKGKDLEKIATAYDASSGRFMEVFTTEPGLQFYTGNFLDGTLKGKQQQKYQQHAGFCMETQHFPDAPNQPSFPNTIVKPGESYRSLTYYRFSVK
ncbi:MAG: galactose mutarotase [Chitinophagaceae bacterium]|nr:galactose mutarotase [Chitinophagaceae bacterium]MCA6456333.1 galactose mutarotase [Chitinophagaceae bacterium]MCA6460181.1 galactose mutarotase [Chitinophagaceae bacterium]MCA6466002.1 galactose mutarotase [Chitinophagaceae bacterium]MEA3425937.1 aldose epimerase family protein [Bacteroidota bacterium]